MMRPMKSGLPAAGLRGVRCNAISVSAQVPRPISEANITTYKVTDTQRLAFERDGFVLIPRLLSESEMSTVVDPVYYACLHDQDAQRAATSGEAVNVRQNRTMPRMRSPSWRGNLLQQRCQAIAMQLLGGEEVELDFDQILAKAPHSPGSTTPWHQDAAFWPASEGQAPDAGPSANCWLAVSEVPVESGCMRYVPGSHKDRHLRPHAPVPSSSSALPMLHTQTKWERAVLLPMSRGDVVVHREHVVHGSGPNVSSQWRCAYVLNFKRSARTLHRQ
ncbi:PhyH-domain-containing protein [Haematococcus lacustris]